ncbi:MAG: glycosyltransferase [Ruminococcus sp.]|uniref:Glycosyl transferase family 2 n=1 Tax=Ruminococcus albus TaxID=1264 RepID=A0A1H7MWZ3_RUMAL|nr:MULTISPECIES: glycosyltransferase [Ruminococcus]MBO4865585.1 glycosyltransferase [Ruminococcus sp.]SEL15724.1 Glycosyl transferase family 2 [Ruminococcus albus]
MIVEGYELPKYSVLMSVYDQELPENLNQSLESMLKQSYPPSDFVLVCDGKLTNALDVIVKSFQNEYKDIFRIVRIDENVGAGKAVNKGIKACRYEYIVRMDSDDVSLRGRCMKEMFLFAVKPELDIVGSFVEEFDDLTDKTLTLKRVPLEQKEILSYSKQRNPFNRQTVAFRKSKALKVGGYSDLKLCEDYDFAVRMLADGAKGQNIPEVLVRYRVSESTPKIRSSWRLTKGFIAVRWKLFTEGYIGLRDFFTPCFLQLILFIFPMRFTRWFYRKFLRDTKITPPTAEVLGRDQK